MPSLKTYDFFISHAWFYSKGYNRVVELLNNAPCFSWRNYSVPEHDPVVDPNTKVGKRKLSDELDQQIRPVNCFLVIAGMYANHKYWIQKEVKIAQSYGKPIVGLIPWGQERTPTYIQEVADIMVAWNTSSIVQAIRNYAL
ncbi:MAG: nuclease [Desulfobacterales bacterium S5133MH16]|nr:MAG: nuclease [Desulfobacterales bacterium S5133MH16]